MRVVALLFFCAVVSANPTAEAFDLRVQQFEKHWNLFLRAYWGCGPKASSRVMCEPSQMYLDLKEFERARDTARELFELR